MLIGLTGGIGCGKSTVLTIFQELGWDTIDADGICRDLYKTKDPRLVAALTDRWPDQDLVAPGGEINKQRIAEIVFQDISERRFLEGILHPLVKAEATRITSESPGDYLFDIPLLYEAGWEDLCCKVIAVWSDAETQHQRLVDRGWSDEEIERRIGSQMSPDEKLEKADYGLINTGSIETLRLQCEELARELKP